MSLQTRNTKEKAQQSEPPDATASPRPDNAESRTIATTHPEDPIMRAESSTRSDIKSDTRQTELHAVYLVGGSSAVGYDHLYATPGYDRLVEFAEAGGVVMGSSAGAMIFGRAKMDWYRSEDQTERFDLFGWLPLIVETHHLPGSARLGDATSSFGDETVLAVAHDGAVVYDHESSSVRAVIDGYWNGEVVPSVLARPGQPLIELETETPIRIP